MCSQWGACDLVLGTYWFGTLGVIQWDFKLLTMSFFYGQQSVLLHCLRSAGSHMQDLHQFLKETVKRGQVLHILVQPDPSSANYRT